MLVLFGDNVNFFLLLLYCINLSCNSEKTMQFYAILYNPIIVLWYHKISCDIAKKYEYRKYLGDLLNFCLRAGLFMTNGGIMGKIPKMKYKISLLGLLWDVLNKHTCFLSLRVNNREAVMQLSSVWNCQSSADCVCVISVGNHLPWRFVFYPTQPSGERVVGGEQTLVEVG